MNNALTSELLQSGTAAFTDERGLIGFSVTVGHFSALYKEVRTIDGIELPVQTSSVDRDTTTLDQAFADWLQTGMDFIKKWRQADEDQRAADAAAAVAEAARWDALTVDQRQAELDAKRATQAAAAQSAAIADINLTQSARLP